MNNRDQFSSFSGMSTQDRIEDMKRRSGWYDNRPDPRGFNMPNYAGSPHDRIFDRTFGNRASPQPASGEARSVPINVQHQQQQTSAGSHPGAQQPQNPPQNPASDSGQNPNAAHNPQHPYYESNIPDDFYPPGFMPFSARDPEFFGFRRPEFMNRMNEQPADGKVVHIPIHVESGQQNSANHRQSSPQPQPQQHYPAADRLNSSSSSLPNNIDMTKQQTGNGVRFEQQPQPRQQQPSVYSKAQPVHNQYQQGSASQGDIPIQVLREQSPINGAKRESRKAPPQSNPQPQAPLAAAEQPEEKDPAPIPMPYSPLNSTKDSDMSVEENNNSNNKNNSNGKNQNQNPNPKQNSKSSKNTKAEACTTMKSTARDCIDSVLNDIHDYERDVNAFVGTSNDKAYKYLDEMLTRCILKLDDIDTAGNEELRKHRKSAVNEVERIARLLESRVANSRPADSASAANDSGNSGTQSESQDGDKQEDGEQKAQENGAQEADVKGTDEQSTDKAADKEKDKKDKPKRKFFFIKSKKEPTVTDTNNNAVTGKETAV